MKCKNKYDSNYIFQSFELLFIINDCTKKYHVKYTNLTKKLTSKILYDINRQATQ